MTCSRADPHGWISPTSVRIVGKLADRGPLDILELSRGLAPLDSYATVHRWVNKLVEAGLVTSTTKGNKRVISLRPYYLTDTAVELYRRLKFRDAMHTAPKELVNAALNLIEGLSDLGALEAYFHGSFAKGMARRESDIDVLVVVPEKSDAADRIHELAVVISDTIAGEIHPIVMETGKFRELAEKRDPFVMSALKGIRISFAPVRMGVKA